MILKLCTFLFCFVLLGNEGFAQPESLIIPPKDWFLKDPELDQFPGLSSERAYTLLKGMPSQTVIVGVVDTGVDIEHEDLKNIIWTNSGEIAGNGIDDDHNGYIDDVHGWNFIGGKNGNVNEDTYEITREYARLKLKFENTEKGKKLSKKEKSGYNQYLSVKKRWEEKRDETLEQYELVSRIYSNAIFSLDTLKKFLKSDDISMEQLATIKSNDPVIVFSKSFMRNFLASLEGESIQNRMDEIKDAYETYKMGVEFSSNPDFDPRYLVGDNYQNTSEKNYGNNHVSPLPGPFGDHGTHVAGIIGADRTNQIGINGIADHVKIMPIRAVPNGDERDKDIANAIYYAVDNGAKIINLSCGKTESPQKEAVDKAIQYAESKNVLIVHAAGNESADVDMETYYPEPRYNNGKSANNWINVAASSWGTGDNFIGSFTNYGKKTVDVFSPGVAIYSTIPGNGYKNHDGTSMACPAVAGVAAMLMSYFPEFSAVEIKNIILESSRRFDGLQVPTPGIEEPIEFSQLTKTGGIVNAYDAVQLALKKRGEKKINNR